MIFLVILLKAFEKDKVWKDVKKENF